MEDKEFLINLFVIGILFVCFFLIISIFGSSILYIIHKRMKKKGLKTSKSVLENLFISFGLGISVYVSFGYIMLLFKLFNFFIGYLSFIIFDISFLVYYLKKNKKKIIVKYNEKYFKDIFLNKRNLISFGILLLVFFLGFHYYWDITTESLGLLSKDNHKWLAQLDYLLQDYPATVWEEEWINFHWIYPSGFTFINAGILLPTVFLPNFMITYFLIKMISIYYLFILITILFILLKKLFQNNSILLFSLMLIFISIEFLHRFFFFLPSSFSVVLTGISFLLIINDDYPDYIHGFFIAALFLIHPLTCFYYIFVFFFYFLFKLFLNIKNRELFLKQIFSVLLLIFISLFLILPFILYFPNDIIKLINHSLSKITFFEFKILKPKSLKLKISLIPKDEDFQYFENYINFEYFEDYIDPEFLTYLNELFYYSISYFFIASIIGIFLNNYYHKRKSKVKDNLIFFKLCVTLCLIFYFIPYFFPEAAFFSGIKYRVLESFILPIIIMAASTIKKIIVISEKFLHSIIKHYEVPQKMKSFLTLKSKRFKKLQAIFRNNYKLFSKGFRLDTLLIILLILNVCFISETKTPPNYNYKYDDEFMEVSLYIRNNIDSGSIILHPAFPPWTTNACDYLYYDMDVYYYYPTPLIDSLILMFQDKEVDYLIFDTDLNVWTEDMEVYVEIIDTIKGSSEVIKLDDQELEDKEGNKVYANLQYYFNGKEDGTIEWDFLRENSSGKNNFNFFFNHILGQKRIKLYITKSNQIRLWDGTADLLLSDKFTNEEWHHFRVDFECGDDEYKSIGKQKFDIYFDGIKIGDDCNMIHESSDDPEIKNKLHYLDFSTSGDNVTAYIDNLNFSWEDNDFWHLENKEYSFKKLFSNKRYILYQIK